jgi:hypothetical protein
MYSSAKATSPSNNTDLTLPSVAIAKGGAPRAAVAVGVFLIAVGIGAAVLVWRARRGASLGQLSDRRWSVLAFQELGG